MDWIQQEEALMGISEKMRPVTPSTISCYVFYLSSTNELISHKRVSFCLEEQGIVSETRLRQFIKHYGNKQSSLIGFSSFHLPFDHDKIETFSSTLPTQNTLSPYFHEYNHIQSITFAPSLPILHDSSFLLLVFKEQGDHIVSKPILKSTDSSVNKKRKTVRFNLRGNKRHPVSFQKTKKNIKHLVK